MRFVSCLVSYPSPVVRTPDALRESGAARLRRCILGVLACGAAPWALAAPAPHAPDQPDLARPPALNTPSAAASNRAPPATSPRSRVVGHAPDEPTAVAPPGPQPSADARIEQVRRNDTVVEVKVTPAHVIWQYGIVNRDAQPSPAQHSGLSTPRFFRYDF